MRVLVLGAGKMLDAVLTGLKKTENLSDWLIYSPSGESARKLAGKVGAGFISDLSLVKNPDWVLVGCKPQQLRDLKLSIADQFNDSLFVSILAALSEEDQLKTLGAKELIRLMPNLPVEFNKGVCLLSSVSASKRLSSFESFFSKLGLCLVVKEDELEELTLLTGSGPALFYEFSRSLSQSFSSLGDEQREKLIRQVLKGAGMAVSCSKDSLEDMTNAVTSKAGVTIAILEEWRKENFLQVIKSGIKAGLKRTQEIKAHLHK